MTHELRAEWHQPAGCGQMGGRVFLRGATLLLDKVDLGADQTGSSGKLEASGFYPCVDLNLECQLHWIEKHQVG